MIKIWKFRDAPIELKQLAPQSSECTWVLKIPEPMVAEVDGVLHSGSQSVTVFARHELDDGTVVMFAQETELMMSSASRSQLSRSPVDA